MSDTDLAPITTSEPAADLATSSDGALAAADEMDGDAVQYLLVVGQLAIASVRLARLSEQVRGTYRYVEGCAASVQRLADQAAGMNVDRDTIGEHRDAAKIMLSVLEEAEAMAVATAELSTLFQATADAHEADYGPVDDAAAVKEGEMADREFYANR